MSYPQQQRPRGPVRRFFSMLWGGITWLRIALTNLFFLAIVIIIVVAISQNKPEPLPDSFALHLAPSGQLVDQRQAIDPLGSLFSQPDSRQAETLVADVVKTIDTARDDERVTHLVLNLEYLSGGGISKLEEIARALEQFRESGKAITALSTRYNQSQYYLASFADKVYLHDMGTVLLTGFGSYRSYFKEALEKLAIDFHVFRAGAYKDAVEPYTRSDMSEQSRAHNRLWLNDLWQFYTTRIETQRDLTAGSTTALINSADQALLEAGGDTAKLAQNAGWVDDIISRQHLRAELINQFGYDKDHDTFKAVDWYRYLAHSQFMPTDFNQDKVGVIVTSGTILEGEQPEGAIGSETVINLLRQARKDSSIKALVIRIDSGGGSAFASELIRSEIATTRDTGIPVIISMGSVAASGGYWMAAAGDEIWALPTTITGSIGVYGLMPTLDRSLAKLGIDSDGVGTTDMADAFYSNRPLNPIMASAMQQNVDALYQRFIHTVANARGLEPKAVHEIAQGQVWSGSRAHELGLVDKLGTLNDAIAAAAGFAELENWEVKNITRPLSPTEQLLQQFFNSSVAKGALSGAMGQSLSRLQQLSNHLTDPIETLLNTDDSLRIYAHCLNCSVDGD